MGTQSITPTPRRLPVPLGIALALLLVLYAQAQARTQTQTQTPATSVPLLLPSAIAYDAHGNLFIAEAAGHDIRKVDAAGNISTVAGTGAQGFSGDGGPATSAELDSPQGIAVDSSGNLYIADTHNHRIRKINATGIIATIAGTGIAGYSGDNAAAASAQLDLPTAIALDASDNLYIADNANHRIRKIDATTGIITTVAGNGTEGYSGDNGPAAAASLDSPAGLAIDPSGNIYIADTHNHRIRKIDATTGTISTVAGTGTPGYSGDNAAAATAKLALPHGLAIDAAGNLYIADTRNQRVRKIDAATGQITSIAGQGIQTFSGDNAAAATASLDTPRAVTASPTGLITLADTANQRIRRLDSANPAIIYTVAGLGSGQATRLAATISIATSAAVAATGQPVTLTATVASTTGKPTGTITLLDGPIALDTIQVPATGQVAFTTAALTAGSHAFTAVYSGDSNFTAATSAPATIGIGVPAVSDFALSADAATSKTIAPGNSATFNFTVQWQGTPLSSPITLSATGLPPLAKASFNPAYLPPGAPTDTFTLTVTTAGTTASRRIASPFAFALLLLPIGLTLRRARKPATILAALLITAALTLSAGCGDRINTAGLDTSRATPYTITVTGTATTPTGTTIARTATVTLIIQKPT